MNTTTEARRHVPAKVWKMPLSGRIKWARTEAKLSHDRLAERMGRSNRGHLIKIEKGDHTPRPDLRDAIADATNVPRELLADEEDDEADQMLDMFEALLARARGRKRTTRNDPPAHLSRRRERVATTGGYTDDCGPHD